MQNDKIRPFLAAGVKIFFGIILPTVCACLILLEIGLRLTGQFPSNTTDGFFEQYKTSYRLKKNITKIQKTAVYACTVHTNAMGFRDKLVGAREFGSRPYFAFLGESLTFGNGLDYEKTFVGLMDQFMQPCGMDVVNLAVGGHRFWDQEELFHDFIRSVPKKPSKVLICFSPLFIEWFDRPYEKIVIKNGYLFESRNWILPYIRITLGNSSTAYCYFRDSFRKIQARLLNYDRTYARQQLELYSRNNRFADVGVAGAFEKKLEGLDEFIRSTGATPIYVYLPLSTDFSLETLVREMGRKAEDYDVLVYYGLLQKHCEEHRIPLINIYPALRTLAMKGAPINFGRDAHYNVPANQVIAETLFQALRNDGEISSAAGETKGAAPAGR